VPSKTIVSGAGFAGAVVGQWVAIELTTFDIANHVSNPDITKTSIVFDGPGHVDWNITMKQPAVPQSGISILKFMTLIAGFYHAMVDVDGIHLGPFNFVVKPAAADPSRAIALLNQIPATAGQNNVFTVVSYDYYGNPVVVGGLKFEVDIALAHGAQNRKVQNEIVDSNDGTYSVTWMAEQTGIYTISVRHVSEVGDA
jgi:hypothetical protein